ncbi:transcriptional regulator, TraR/DksA family [Pseudonocardia dioxanivorans CB1190]|uniref:Transcriptional regulator, TraR/DksA family n=1 Tax=Pseudonocardia dioxanivorans (strain ATCC 55486 / DSM 44775 / JCM 13855 / CB1190) TaxID=675635 RepID=F4CUA2_PSEUX|nr:TraR/DksA C4-type zinc finger protein [Pseudonocardia dioxanivorans]AEA24561.1 transcriptional regulator, TraR/DksA family [Pseudonocardia dioxanivorans CB1190]
MDDAHARTLLREELRRIDHELADRRSGGPLRPDESDRRAVDEADRASRETETMEADLAEGTLRTQRRRLDAALDRLERGEYGRCTVCGREIDDERLSIRPETDRCRDHPEEPR